ncbi:MAG: M23 family metallopeptidase [Flavobacteriaceae bacterium]|nr:M23 family metallopeptidase [Flavobacteriaceae bacterium]MDG1343883.1 M23 family metallopeptidase [Flavobacteriaceae bacterium]MDG1792778.1 M23 family metallopeptidase [Flavobacteriaceae bacterium]|tara:strand:- start:1456 stop:3126 length:1671 start_codon:yes stop_codon:yes gene_type:complete
MKKLIFLVLFISININSQTNYPKDYFSNPLNIEIILNGNFGESRPSHFHSGIDFKTQFKEGLDVFSSAEGYVSRISIKHGGFGKALYINHPNGFTTVYGHLKKFNKKIEDYIKRIQYNKKTYQIEHYLKKDVLKIDGNEKIANSGNTGSSSGPHLHYEIRLTKNQKAINPQLFGFDIKDTRKPTISSVFLYNLDSLSNIGDPTKLKIKKINDSVYQSEKVFTNGTIGFGISGFDRQDLANNKNGIYKYSTYYNNKKIIDFNFESFYFEESIKIKTLIDYKYYIKNKSRIIKLFKDKGNDLSIYLNNKSGYIDVENNSSFYKIIVSDLNGNKSIVKIPIIKSDLIIDSLKKIKLFKSNKNINNKLDYNFKFENAEIKIAKNTFTKEIQLNIESLKDSIKIINPEIAVFKNIKINFFNKNKKKGNYLALKDKDGNESFATANLNSKNYFYHKTKSLGTYFVKNDSLPPLIQLKNFKNNDWISNKNFIRLNITDKETGIKNYKVKINSKWTLFEYEYKKNELFYEFDSYFLNQTKNLIEVFIEDLAGNKTQKNFTFFRN